MPYVKSVVQFIAASVYQIRNGTNYEYEHDLDTLVRYWMPSGSGIDCGTRIDIVKSTSTKLIFTFDFHHMNQDGFYCGWTNHKLIVTPDFEDFNMRITGQHPSRQRHNTQYFHDYLYSTFSHALQSRYNYTVDFEGKLCVYTNVERPSYVITTPAHWLKRESTNV